MQTSLFAASNPELQEFQDTMKTFRHRLDAYYQCWQGTCSPEEKQIILKAAIKDGARLALGITALAGAFALWHSGIRSIGILRKGRFILEQEGYNVLQYIWNEPWTPITKNDFKNLLRDIQKKQTSSPNMQVRISKTMYVPGTLGPVHFESDVGKIKDVLNITFDKKKIKDIKTSKSQLARFDNEMQYYLKAIAGKTIDEALNL